MKKNLLRYGIFLSVLFSQQVAFGQITGTVFRDYNGNGTKESAEPLVAGVEVKAYNTTGTQCGTTQTTTAASAPNYTLSGCTGAVRIEFTIPAGACFADNGIDYAALGGGAHGTSVQFLANTSAGTRTANFALFYPGEYGGADSFQPDIYNVIMRVGDPIPSVTPPSGDITYTANQKSVVYTGYNTDAPMITDSNGGLQANEANRQLGHTTLALAGQTGTLWGNVYSKQANRLFVSAFLRRHAGMGPLGPGGIYIINPSSPSLSGSLAFANLDALGFPTHAASGALNVKSNPVRNLVPQPFYSPSTDADAYDQVGKTSFGDMDISENGRYLFVVNLYDRKLYKIDLQDAQNPVSPTAAQIESFSIMDPCSGTNAGVYRPFGLKVFRGKIYAGVVCSGQDANNNEIGTTATMSLNLISYDLDSNNTPSNPQNIYNQNFVYRNNDILQDDGVDPPSPYGGARWEPWENEFSQGRVQPIFSDIEFDNDGAIIIGLTDRNNYQTGGGNANLLGQTPFTKGYANGDIIKIARNTATCTNSLVTGSYFQNDFYQDQSLWSSAVCGYEYCHAEITLGGLATHRRGTTNELTSTALNPVSYTSNGYITFNNSTGSQIRQNEIWADYCDPNSEACLWKAGAVGDIEVLSLPAPIEIGNRVWLDADNDGIQDAGEAGISGVQVQLIKGGTTISTATTDANGNYYFSSATGTDTASIKYGLTQLEPNMAYTVRFPTTTTVAGTTYNLTTQAAGSNRLIDSNAPANGDVTILATDIPVSGANNHSFDVGYSAVACVINTPTVNVTCNDNGTGSNPADDTFTFTISTTGTGTGANYKVDKTAPAPTATVFASVNYGTTSAASSSYPISGGNLTLTLTDNTTSSCTLTNVNVPAPAPCSTPPAGQPDLKLLKTASSSSVNSGQTLTYTITLTNEGTASATGVVVRDVLPAAVTYVNSSASQGSYNNATGLWTVGTVAVGTPLTLTITVTVN